MKNILIIVVAVVIVGGGAYLFFGGDNGVEDTQQTGLTTENFTGRVADLMRQGRSIECSFEHADGNNVVSGMVYIANENELRGDFRLANALTGDEFESHVIRDGQNNYVWSELFPGGFVTPIDPEDDIISFSDDENAPDLEDDIQYKCSGWNVDRSLLTPPSDIEFQNIGAETSQIREGQEDVKALQCGACDSIPDPASQAECRAALGCS